MPALLTSISKRPNSATHELRQMLDTFKAGDIERVINHRQPFFVQLAGGGLAFRRIAAGENNLDSQAGELPARLKS